MRSISSRLWFALGFLASSSLSAEQPDGSVPSTPSASRAEAPGAATFGGLHFPRPRIPAPAKLVPSESPRRAASSPVARAGALDPRLQRTGSGTQVTTQPPASAMAAILSPYPAESVINSSLGGQSLSLEAALYGALTNNPDLVTLRQGNPLAASAEAVEVARHFPTTLNPTAWIDYRPITLIPNGTFGTSSPSGSSATNPQSGYYHHGQNYIVASIRQPIELGHQTTHRYNIAKAAYDQQRWTVMQAELTALVQTYRIFQTAAYRREKHGLAIQLADFNDRLLSTLRRRLEANQVPAADVTLAQVESRATRQLVKVARQDYLTALADLRNQLGMPDEAAAAEPLGEFNLPAYIPPIDEQAMVQTAIANRPDIHAAEAGVAAAHAAVHLAKGDRIPTPVIGPQYSMDEAGIQYVGFVLVSQLPIWNNGKPLVLQREAEHQRAMVAAQQAQQRAIAQVRAAVSRWNGSTDLVNDSVGLTDQLAKDVATMERLFDAGQTDLTRLMQARQRLIQLDNSRLDAVWAATQAQADLLLAMGAPWLIQSMLGQAQADAQPTTPRATAAPNVKTP